MDIGDNNGAVLSDAIEIPSLENDIQIDEVVYLTMENEWGDNKGVAGNPANPEIPTINGFMLNFGNSHDSSLETMPSEDLDLLNQACGEAVDNADMVADEGPVISFNQMSENQIINLMEDNGMDSILMF